MALIVSIEKRRGVVTVVLEDEPTLRIPGPLFRERPLRAGAPLDTAQYRDWMRSRAYGFALDAAVTYLAARPRTVHEVQRRLAQAGYEEENIALVVERLSREGYLNDAVFADQWVQSRGGRALGARRLAQELRKKGVDKEAAASALAQMDEDEHLRIAITHAQKLLLRTRGKDERDVRRKVLQALLRRGYDWDMARAALEQADVDAVAIIEEGGFDDGEGLY